ncbi:MAG: DUF3596 domain-containing protein [Phycisphaerales bacterium]|nr:MAG: DUF3596 domain-containing protein [Phycisphaerales bacterium]
MGHIRKRAHGRLAFVFSWKGKRHTKSLGTTDEQEAEAIRERANEQLDRIRKGESAWLRSSWPMATPSWTCSSAPRKSATRSHPPPTTIR